MIGIYGGTFDPVHYGHLRTAMEIKTRLNLDQMRLIPCKQPPHRPQPAAASESRWQMLQLALADSDGLIPDSRELERGGPSYMIDTLISLQQDFPGQTLLLVIGLDAFAGLTAWRQWQQLFDHAHVAVMTRPGYSHPPPNDFLQRRVAGNARQLAESAAGLLWFQPV